MNGLSAEEVKKKTEKGLVNVNPDGNKTRSVKHILLSNTLTFFNLLNIAYFVLIIVSGSYKNGLFIWIVIVNSVLGIVQELRTKRLLDKLTLLNAAKVPVIRDGVTISVPSTNLVLGDFIILRPGAQIPADSVIRRGEIEVNESLITGESDNIMKKPEADVLSGSFVVSGEAVAEIVHVGKDNYIETISGEAKKFKKVNSELRNSVNKILRVISYIIVPISVAMFAKFFFLRHESFRFAVEQVVSSGIGMIPEGLYLLTTLALTLGVLRLAKKKTLVQELYCIETLARVDTLCLDKTGTLTEGRMQVEEVTVLRPGQEKEMELAFQNILAAQSSTNETAKAILEYYGEAEEKWDLRTVIPFSSDRKYSGASFRHKGTYYMGAQQFLCPAETELQEIVKKKAAEGLRVIVLAHSLEEKDDFSLSGLVMPIGYVTIRDVIRKDCKETLEFFKKQGVALKCISGDDPATVSKIASIAGLDDADHYIDATLLETKDDIRKALDRFTVFGRVKPEQKKAIVECLQEAGHTVAMTGDGVNDVLAMKQANCSVAMAAGSEATKLTADVVLLNNDFSAMPVIFNEGRRVINNICASATMFLIKTTFSVLLAILTIIVGQSYPFTAIQLSVINTFAVGIPTFLLQLEPNFSEIPKHFMSNVFRNAFPTGLTIAVVSFLVTNVGLAIDPNAQSMVQTISVLSTGWIYFYMLKRIFPPVNGYRRFVIYSMEGLYILAIIFIHGFLEFSPIPVEGIMALIATITIGPIAIDLFGVAYDKLLNYYLKRKEQKKRMKEIDSKGKKVL